MIASWTYSKGIGFERLAELESLTLVGSVTRDEHVEIGRPTIPVAGLCKHEETVTGSDV